MNELKRMLGMESAPEADFCELVKCGAVILDVRSEGEYAGGHVSGSVNIPVDRLGNSLQKLEDKSQPVITCCASGVRSEKARRILLSCGYSTVHNGGGWHSLNQKIKGENNEPLL